MLPKEVLKKIKAIQIRTDKLVNDVMSGEYVSAFKGRGIEFEGVREYYPGDDIRTIDWNVTARMGHPFVKEYKEERELTVIIMVDVSFSGQFGSQSRLKNEIAAEIAAVLAYSAIKNNDKVGLIIFTKTPEIYIPPKKGTGHVWRVIREVLYYKPKQKGTNLGEALEFLSKVSKKKVVCFMISDFLSDDLKKEFEKPLRIAKQKHDLITVTITDPREVNLPQIGFIELEDAETGESILIDTYDKNFIKQFTRNVKEDIAEREKIFKSSNVDHIDIWTNKSYVEPIIQFFRMREKKLRH